MSSDTSLVFNLVARDQASAVLGSMKEKFATAATAVSAGVAAAFAVGVTASLDLSSASSKLQAQLGIGPAKAAELSKVTAKVYSQAWGESVGQVNEAVRGVYQQIGDVSKVKGGLQGVTTDVLALAQTFDQDLGGVTNAVGQMIKTGLVRDAKEGLDVLTRGFQLGNDKAGDLLDTMNEYSTQFRDMGIDGKTAMGIIQQGLKGGARDADIVADAMKELNIRVKDGQSAAPALQALGLSAGEMAAAFGAGGPKAVAALDTITDRLRTVKDPAERYRLSQQLLGTQSEDLAKALYSIDPSAAVKSLGKISGAADTMAKTVGNNPAAALESFKRQAQLKLAEISGHFVQFVMANQGVVKPLVMGLAAVAAVILAIRAGQIAWTAATTAWTAVTTVATGVQWAYNAALAANPITLIIIAVVALVAAIVVLWKTNDAFRQFMTAAWSVIWGGIKTGWNWVRKNWPLLLAILTGPVGLAVYFIVKKGDGIVAFFSKLPGRIGRATSGLFDGVKNAFRSAINFVIGGWNGLQFSIPSIDTHIPGVGKVGGTSFGTPDIPYLAKGGHILTGGWAMVGENGPEAVHLGAGATVAPLTRGGAGGVIHVVIDLPGESELARVIRKTVRVTGRGNVQVAFGTNT